MQLHADKLYHQMLDYENRVAEARAVGQEPPPQSRLSSIRMPNPYRRVMMITMP